MGAPLTAQQADEHALLDGRLKSPDRAGDDERHARRELHHGDRDADSDDRHDVVDDPGVSIGLLQSSITTAKRGRDGSRWCNRADSQRPTHVASINQFESVQAADHRGAGAYVLDHP